MAKPSLESVHSVEPHVAAVLAADMVGYTQHMCRDEAGTLVLLRSLRRNLLYPSTRKHGGRVIKSSGDGVIIEFSSARHAVRCAIELQRSILSLNGNVEESRRVSFRMGVCVGDIDVDLDGDIYGNCVNLASRLESIAPSGGICLSQAVLDQVRDKIKCEPVDWGLIQLKNIDRVTQVFVITPELIAQQAEAEISLDAAKWHPSSRNFMFISTSLAMSILLLSSDQQADSFGIPSKNERDRISVAHVQGGTGAVRKEITPRMSVLVLPFKNPDGGPREDLLAEAITADITSDLTRIATIFVVSNDTAQKYRDRLVDPQEIGRQLDVRYIFSGTMRHANGRLRVNAQLIDASTGAQIWADRFKSYKSSTDEIEDEIVERLVKTLTSGLDEAEVRRIQK